MQEVLEVHPTGKCPVRISQSSRRRVTPKKVTTLPQVKQDPVSQNFPVTNESVKTWSGLGESGSSWRVVSMACSKLQWRDSMRSNTRRGFLNLGQTSCSTSVRSSWSVGKGKSLSLPPTPATEDFYDLRISSIVSPHEIYFLLSAAQLRQHVKELILLLRQGQSLRAARACSLLWGIQESGGAARSSSK